MEMEIEEATVAPAIGVAVAVSKDTNSKHAVRWALDKYMSPGQSLMLIHVRARVLRIPTPMGNYVPISQVCEDAVAGYMQGVEAQTKEMLLPYEQLCRRRQVQTKIVVVEEDDVALAIVQQISNLSISKLVIGASSRNAITRRFKGVDVPASVAKSASNFCTVYVISKGKLTSVRSASSTLFTTGSSVSSTLFTTGSTEDAYSVSSFCSDISSSNSPGVTESTSEDSTWFSCLSLPSQRNQALSNINRTVKRSISNLAYADSSTSGSRYSSTSFRSQIFGTQEENEVIRSGSSSRSTSSEVNYEGTSTPNSEERGSPIGNIALRGFPFIQEVTPSIINAIPSTQNRGLFETTNRNQYIWDTPSSIDGLVGTSQAETNIYDRLNEINEIENINSESRMQEEGSSSEFKMTSTSNIQMKESFSQDQQNIMFELEKLKLELKHTLGMYNLARQEAIDARIKANELNLQRILEARILEVAKAREEQARAIATREKAKSEVAIRQAEESRQLAERETLNRKDAELRAIRELEERKKAEEALASAHYKYRKYSIQEIHDATDFLSESLKIGEGGYGAVYKCKLQHTTAAVKVLRPEATEGIQQFQQEVEVLSRIRHPHMVLLLGACPEHGCLVYEYMANGSLEDRLSCKGNTHPLPWFVRFRIAWEVASALLFLHSSKPKPIVHRDLKPANILLDCNLVSKIGDVGLARLVPVKATTTVTEYKDTVPAGTFCYMDPEYQRTGTLGPGSDVYALGITLLQLLTAKSPMAITHIVETAIEAKCFEGIIDKNAGDWPTEEALCLAQLGLKCAELRRRDRPDLEKDIMPELERLKALADATFHVREGIDILPPSHFLCPILQEVMEDPYVASDGFTYEHRAIQTWLESNNTSPMTNLPMAHKNLIPNHTLRSAILDWLHK
ncbi:U-box domain-containing protein 35 [Cryptomeria japonica]|uniref:U-box domain-containing protein 35 n=1 Tax=Cryptomeria japonica TaxID=3369 RepID=UPI0027DA6AF3|nr:U-box domain-containing protein 35 [Cryptomeria japonica]XP_057873789.2 U-box domain-containing protein 35 [Cryptomeria japonica]